MRRYSLVILLFVAKLCSAQEGWQIEVMPGVSIYKGDLSQGAFSLKSIGPGVMLNAKYDFGDMIVLRAGVGYGKVGADDKNNNKADIRNRNLSFKSNIIELSAIAEVNLLDPEAYFAYPYLMTGVGIFTFNPYAYDNNNQKTYLHSLSTEGQGLPEYPGRKAYALTQFFLPFGGGWKLNVKQKYMLSFELGVRYLFTDYLDDVSTTYINRAVLLNQKGPKAVELAFRQTPSPNVGDQRGNPNVKDLYFMSGFKLTYYINKKKKL